MKQKYYECEKCHFKTKEKNKNCPICNSSMNQKEGIIKHINPTLPEKISNEHHKNIKMGYYCFKCRKDMKTKVCLDCNNVGSLYVEYNNKKAIIKRIKHLNEIFNDEEINVINKDLNEHEKTYLYHNYENSYQFFYKKDSNKAIACFIFAIVFYLIFLDITFNMNEQTYIFVSYIFNMIANTLLIILLFLGIWYLIDASNVEFLKIPTKIGILSLIPNVIQLALCIVNDADIKYTLISGFIAIFFGVILNIIYILRGKYEK